MAQTVMQQPIVIDSTDSSDDSDLDVDSNGNDDVENQPVPPTVDTRDHHSAMDQDNDDFQSAKPALTKSPTTNDASPNEDPSAKHVDIDCPICFEPWTSEGKHRIVSLKCGHLFGKACIEQWIRAATKSKRSNEPAKCPACKRKAAPKDIRPIYTKNLVALDATERDSIIETREDALLALELERKKTFNMEVMKSNYNLLTGQLQMENSRLRAKIAELEQEKSQRENPVESRHEYILSMTASLNGEPHSVRVLAHVPQENLVLVSKACGQGKHGLLCVDLSDTTQQKFVEMHKGLIRDCQVSPHTRDLVATSSLDKTLRLTSLRSETEVQRFSLAAAGWSCSFVPGAEHLVCAGLGSNAIVMYDSRFHSIPIATIERYILGPGGIHSLVGVGSSLLGASSACVFGIEGLNADPNSAASEALDTFPAASCMTFAYDAESNSCVATWRGSESATVATLRHQVYQIKRFSGGRNEQRQRRLIHDYHVDMATTSASQARSCLFSHPEIGRPILAAAAGDSINDVTSMLTLWSPPNNPFRSIGYQQPQISRKDFVLPGLPLVPGSYRGMNTIMDVCRLKTIGDGSSRDMIIALTPSKLHFLEWK
ncbi:hypothetical protein SeLEV6574_g08288 [Synchytrium endobioticum]|uniref:RING-type E3 ubiquitin transferase n=1 Tax=Synchytrium endobioticum TaxID=286115 RepID=A0A507C8Y3_9FUNG|nr:hypothetical protein SeLEV6574_g08288 [Synchytrium endobioticum]